MKIMPDTATWDPADIRYNVIRWVSSDLGYAIGPSFVNPKTGQILGADITVDFGFLPYTQLEEDLFGAASTMDGHADPIETYLSYLPKQQIWKTCTYTKEAKMQYAAAQTMVDVEGGEAGQLGVLQKEFYTELIMHEMGHTMGLMHNMKASQMLSPAELKDISVTSQLGTMASVMDYSALNISSDEAKRGNYYCIRPGPYDKWAIEYGYTECKPEQEAAVLAKIASRSNDPHLVFGNDADIAGFGSGIDPRVQVWDMSNDMVTYAEDRYRLVNQLMPKLKEKYVKPGQSYADMTAHYNYINRDRFTMSIALSRYIGGIYVDRSFPDQQSANKPFTVVSVEYQKKALGVLSKYVFAPHAFDADTYLFPYLQRQRRGFDFFGTTENPKPQNLVLAIQSNVLVYLLYPTSLQRINTSSLYGNSYSVADLMDDLNTAIFKEDLKGNVNLYRQNLQTEYVRRLIAIVSAPPGAYDYPSVAAANSSLRKIKLLLASAVSSNEQTKAHRANLVFLIDKALVVK
jgi:hypothetical protein